VAVMNLFALTLISMALGRRLLRMSPQRWIRFAIVVGGGLLITILGSRALMEAFVDSGQSTSGVISNMRVANDVEKNVTQEFPVAGETDENSVADVGKIKARGVLRVGYRPSTVPFSYVNNATELVGFDVEMATLLAKDLGVKVEFIPFKIDNLVGGLERGFFDIAVSGLAMDLELLGDIAYSRPVLQLNRSLVVADYRVREFDALSDLRKHEALTFVYAPSDGEISSFKADFPNITFKEIEGYRDFFKQAPGTYDGLLISAQAGSAWTLFFPNYGVAMVNKENSYPVVYGVQVGNEQLIRLVDTWLELKHSDGSVALAYDYWILGKGAKKSQPRWSVIRNVLGWVD
jgi:ABC-type amino acid transport substrate-binding protein